MFGAVELDGRSGWADAGRDRERLLMHAVEWIEQHGRYLRTIGADALRRYLERQKGQCTWCGGAVPKGRRSWCSQACVDQYRGRCDVQYISRRVYDRDQGVCQECGRDTERISSLLGNLRSHYLLKVFLHRMPCEQRRLHANSEHEWDATRREFKRHLRDSGLLAGDYGHMWEADHILAVSEGGGLTTAGNYRTLCIPCHRLVTRALAGRRKTAR